MIEWFNFFLYAIQKLITTVFNLNLGIGFSLGDAEVALLIIGLVATALIVKTGSFASVSHETVTGTRTYAYENHSSKSGYSYGERKITRL